jgi:hypothetical protein
VRTASLRQFNSASSLRKPFRPPFKIAPVEAPPRAASPVDGKEGAVEVVEVEEVSMDRGVEKDRLELCKSLFASRITR